MGNCAPRQCWIKIVEKQSARSAHPNVSDGNATQSKVNRRW